MRNKFFIFGGILVLTLICVYGAFADEPTSSMWYRVKTLEGNTVFEYEGSSKLNETEFIEEVKKGNFVVLDNLVYKDQKGEVKSITEWDPDIKPRVYMNPKYIVAVLPLQVDPTIPKVKQGSLMPVSR